MTRCCIVSYVSRLLVPGGLAKIYRNQYLPSDFTRFSLMSVPAPQFFEHTGIGPVGRLPLQECMGLLTGILATLSAGPVPPPS